MSGERSYLTYVQLYLKVDLLKVSPIKQQKIMVLEKT